MRVYRYKDIPLRRSFKSTSRYTQHYHLEPYTRTYRRNSFYVVGLFLNLEITLLLLLSEKYTVERVIDHNVVTSCVVIVFSIHNMKVTLNHPTILYSLFKYFPVRTYKCEMFHSNSCLINTKYYCKLRQNI